MERPSITYRRVNFKYTLARRYCHPTPLMHRSDITLGPLVFTADGTLEIGAGYSWDGASGPAIDGPKWMRASLVHDCLYQLMREGYLDLGDRRYADDEMRRVLLQDGMSRFRAWYSWRGVRSFAAYAAKSRAVAPEVVAP